MNINKTEEGLIKYPLHTHKEYEIALYLYGRGYMSLEDEKIPFTKGTVILIPKGARHGSVSESGFCNISITADIPELHVYSSYQRTEDTTGELTSLARLIYEGRDSQTPYLTRLLEAFVIKLSESFKPRSALDLAIEGVVEKINNGFFDSNISLRRILSSSGYAEDYARYCFKKKTGYTPIEYLTKKRIQRAKFLIDLYSDSLPIYEIAEMCGYLDYVYFSKKFKEETGMSPREYSKK